MTNKSIKLDRKFATKSKKVPPHVRISSKQLLKKHHILKQAIFKSSPEAQKLRSEYVFLRASHRKLVRADKAAQASNRDSHAHTILSKDPSLLFKQIRSVKKGKIAQINKLVVDSKVYRDGDVPDGFYDSISKLKSSDTHRTDNCEIFAGFSSDYRNILEICKHGAAIPAITYSDAFKLLMRMKPDVNDYFGLTPNHFVNAGPTGWKHFHLLLTLLVQSVNDTDIIEVNTVYACILFKGHGKDKNSDRSYRTISPCPVIAKALDIFIRDLNIKTWNVSQSECQFQGEGSSHELASLLVTECIQHSLHQLRQPVFVLLLDAKSAFDVVLKELLVKNLFLTGTSGETLIYLNNRIENRKTFLDWNGQIMGPINNEHGLEQGGVSSSDFYKIFSQEQLLSAQQSRLGVTLGPLVVSGIGQADDTALLSNSIHSLYFLLHLTESFCAKYKVQLSSDKTKLLAFHLKHMKAAIDYWEYVNPIKVNDTNIAFSETAEHVGVVRSVTGNLPSLLAGITAHKKALGAVLFSGLARSHSANPAASLRIHQLYANPVLFNGIGSLVLTDKETDVIAQHHKETILRLQ